MAYITGVFFRLLLSPMYVIGFILGFRGASICYNWYSRGNYEKIMDLAVDDKDTIGTYEQYLQQAKRTLVRIAKPHLDAIVFHVNADDMLAWMKEHSLENNHVNRSAYARYQKTMIVRRGVRLMKEELPAFRK